MPATLKDIQEKYSKNWLVCCRVCDDRRLVCKYHHSQVKLKRKYEEGLVLK